jgi:glyoxylase-like metal-dependent hydrolase (beta-lactamase superfamily II)
VRVRSGSIITVETRLRTVTDVAHTDRAQLYFRQLLSGRDFAADDPIASQMVNFAYLIGDRSTGECLLVDPAYAVDELLDAAAADDMRVTGVLATHYHADHIGGSMMGLDIEGIAALLDRQACPIHVQRAEVPWVTRTTGLTPADVTAHDPGDIVSVGAIEVELVHTPGHTPGSQCFLVDGRLVSGDTLFLDGCGRTDLPGSDPTAMIESLNRLAKIADDVILYPGHRYSIASSALMGSVKASNWVFDGIS